MHKGNYDSILDMFSGSVRSSPERIAIKCGEQRLTYQELDQQADLVAGYLEFKELPRHAIVAVAMERTVQLIVVCLGIMKHGSAYLPIDLETPEHRIKTQMINAGVKHIISDALAFSDQHLRAITIHPKTIFSRTYRRQQLSQPHPNEGAYCIYTSGSTGDPKGVLISHGALLNHTQWFIETFNVTESDTILQRTSIAFDASVWELWTGLAAGARTVILPTAYTKHPMGILLTLQQEHISIAQFVPTLLRELARLRPFEHIPCRLIFCGGEPLTWPLVNLVLGKTRAQLVNLYGPTETTIDATYWRVDRDADRTLLPPIGRPIRCMQVYLLDDEGEPILQPLQEGEIVIAGPGVAIGYLNSPYENDLHFTSLNIKGQLIRIYKTGDVGFLSAAGDLCFLGRRDSQHKVNGRRIELLAIEQIVQQTPGVHCAAAYIDNLVSGEKQICIAYVTHATNKSDVEQCIRQTLATEFPPYMHPGQLHALNDLPLLPNGKINYTALCELNRPANSASTDIREKTSTSQGLQRIWREILNLQKITDHSHFFECGATSLSVMMLLGRVANLYNIDLSPKDIFDNPHLAEQVRLIDEGAHHGRESGALFDAYSWRRQMGEETPGLAQLEVLDKPPETPAHLENVVLAFHIQGECSTARLREAFAAVLAQQPALLCSFKLGADGQWHRKQQKMTDLPLPFQLINLDATDQFSSSVADLIAQASLTVFDLNTPPLIRASYVRCPLADDVLIITVHHIAFDGWSGSILMDQLCEHYQTLSSTDVPEYAVQYLSYSDYTDAQQQRLADKVLDKHIDYWKRTLEHLPEPFTLYEAHQRPGRFTFSSAVIKFNLDAHFPAMDHLCKHTGFSLYTIILSAFMLALARNTDTTDLYVRSPVANRTDAALESVVGYFVHPMVIRPQLSQWLPSRQLLAQINDCVLHAYGNALLPPHIFEANCSPRTNAYGSRFPVWYNHHNYPTPQRWLGKALLRSIGVPTTSIKTDVSLNTIRTEDGLVGSLCYYRDAISQARAQALLVDFHQALDELLSTA